MKKVFCLATVITLVLLFGCGCADTGTMKKADPQQPLNGEADILQSWQGDYPTAQLNLLPENQREQAVGFIGDLKTFETVWKAFTPGEGVPKIDFKSNLVLFARNTQFYNRIRIGRVNVTDGVAEVLAMETMSAMPIEEKVAMSLVVVDRKGIKGLNTGDDIIRFSGF